MVVYYKIYFVNQEGICPPKFTFHVNDKGLVHFSYERYLQAGQMTFYTGLSSMKFKTELRYYLKINSGHPQMYFAKCQTFPHCEFDINHLSSDSIKPTKTNDIFSYSIYKTEITKAISPEQYVLLVFCNIDEDCSFETNFYSELDNFVLPEP